MKYLFRTRFGRGFHCFLLGHKDTTYISKDETLYGCETCLIKHWRILWRIIGKKGQ
jgi:hypothetical protein